VLLEKNDYVFTDVVHLDMEDIELNMWNNIVHFYFWMVDVNHYPVDGWIIENLKKYIDTECKLTTFYNHFCLKYEGNLDFLDQCCIDNILHHSKGLALPA